MNTVGDNAWHENCEKDRQITRTSVFNSSSAYHLTTPFTAWAELFFHNPEDHGGLTLTKVDIKMNERGLFYSNDGKGEPQKHVKTHMRTYGKATGQDGHNHGCGIVHSTVGKGGVGPTCFIHSVFYKTLQNGRRQRRAWSMFMSVPYMNKCSSGNISLPVMEWLWDTECEGWNPWKEDDAIAQMSSFSAFLPDNLQTYADVAQQVSDFFPTDTGFAMYFPTLHDHVELNAAKDDIIWKGDDKRVTFRQAASKIYKQSPHFKVFFNDTAITFTDYTDILEHATHRYTREKQIGKHSKSTVIFDYGLRKDLDERNITRYFVGKRLLKESKGTVDGYGVNGFSGGICHVYVDLHDEDKDWYTMNQHKIDFEDSMEVKRDIYNPRKTHLGNFKKKVLQYKPQAKGEYIGGKGYVRHGDKKANFKGKDGNREWRNDNETNWNNFKINVQLSSKPVKKRKATKKKVQPKKKRKIKSRTGRITGDAEESDPSTDILEAGTPTMDHREDGVEGGNDKGAMDVSEEGAEAMDDPEASEEEDDMSDTREGPPAQMSPTTSSQGRRPKATDHVQSINQKTFRKNVCIAYMNTLPEASRANCPEPILKMTSIHCSEASHHVGQNIAEDKLRLLWDEVQSDDKIPLPVHGVMDENNGFPIDCTIHVLLDKGVDNILDQVTVLPKLRLYWDLGGVLKMCFKLNGARPSECEFNLKRMFYDDAMISKFRRGEYRIPETSMNDTRKIWFSVQMRLLEEEGFQFK